MKRGGLSRFHGILVSSRQKQLTRHDARVLIFLIVVFLVPVSCGLDFAFLDRVVELDLEQYGVLPSHGAVVLEVAHGHRFVVELGRVQVIFG